MITKKQFLAFEDVRKSGVTNMFDLCNVEYLTNLSRPQLLEIMKNYGELKAKYIKEIK